MNIVIPMAGRGARFHQVGYEIPKPLIPVLNQPMYSWALASLPLEFANRLIFLCLEEHLRDYSLDKDIKRRYAQYNTIIIPVAEITEGQACTILLAREYINNDTSLLIHNADSYFRSHLAEMIDAKKADVDGIISVFHSSEDRWSFVKNNENGYVTQVAEKEVISTWATTGMYFFSRGKDFVSAAEKMIAQNMRVRNEFYVGPVYNLLIDRGKHIILDIADEMWCMGTPEDLHHFLTNYRGSNQCERLY